MIIHLLVFIVIAAGITTFCLVCQMLQFFIILCSRIYARDPQSQTSSMIIHLLLTAKFTLSWVKELAQQKCLFRRVRNRNLCDLLANTDWGNLVFWWFFQWIWAVEGGRVFLWVNAWDRDTQTWILDVREVTFQIHVSLL